MSKTLAAWVALIASFLGIADSVYLAQAALTGASLTCNITGLDGCNTVAQSAYAHLFGIPLGVYGVAYYAAMFVLAAVFLALPGAFLARRVLWWVAAVGAVASIIFVLIQIFLIQALCVYCLGSAALSFIAFGMAQAIAVTPRPALPVVEPWHS